MNPRSAVIALFLLVALPRAASSAGFLSWATDGVPATTTTGGYFPAAVADGAGGCFVAWSDFRFDTSSAVKVRVQRLDAGGAAAPGWPAEGWAPCPVPGAQVDPVVVSDGAGGALLAWSDLRNGNQDIYAQRVTASGAVAPGWPAEGVAVCVATGAQLAPVIVSDGAGGCIVAWEDARVSKRLQVYGQRLSAAGAALWRADGMPFTDSPGQQGSLALAADDAGGAIAAWSDTLAGSWSKRVLVQRVAGDGTYPWNTTGVVVRTSALTLTGVCLVPDGQHGAIVLLEDPYGFPIPPNPLVPPEGSALLVQHVLADGSVAWAAGGIPVCRWSGSQLDGDLASDGEGGALVAWRDLRTGSADPGVFAQRVSRYGDLMWGDAAVAACTTPALKQFPRVACDAHGGAVVTWEDWRNSSTPTSYDESDIYAQWLDDYGLYRWAPDGMAACAAAGLQHLPVIAPDGATSFIAWLDRRGDGWGVYAQGVRTNLPGAELAVVTASAARVDGVSITWHVLMPGPVRIYKNTAGLWALLRETEPDVAGTVALEDGDVVPGAHYTYELGIVQGLGQAVAGEVRVDVPPLAELTGLVPNPSVGDAVVGFALPDATPARIEMWDLGGRRVLGLEVGDLGPGRHTVDLSQGRHLPPGVYLLRFTRAGTVTTKRAIVMR